MWILPPTADLIEPAVAPEFFVYDVGAIESFGSLARAYYVTEQMPLQADGKPQMNVVVKLIWPWCRIPVIMGRWGQGMAGANEIVGRPPHRPFTPKIVG